MVGEVLPFEQVPWEGILKFVLDVHPRVRYGALHCIGQLASDFHPEAQLKYHHLLIPACVGPLSDVANPRIQVGCTCFVYAYPYLSLR